MTRDDKSSTDSAGLRGAVAALITTAGVSVVDAQATTSDAFTDCEYKIADVTRVGWVEGGIRRHADLTRNFTRRYATTARSLIS